MISIVHFRIVFRLGLGLGLGLCCDKISNVNETENNSDELTDKYHLILSRAFQFGQKKFRFDSTRFSLPNRFFRFDSIRQSDKFAACILIFK